MKFLGLSIPTGKDDLDVESFFSSIGHLSTIAADDAICLEAGRLRKRYGNKLKLPDALHLATALASGVDVFITNDDALARVAGGLLPAKTLAGWR